MLLNAKNNFNKYKTQWDKLNLSLFEGHPLLDSRFAETLLKYFGNNNTALLVGQSKNKISGLALLEKSTVFSWKTFLPGQAPISLSLLQLNSSTSNVCSILPNSCLMVDFLCQDPNYSLIIPTSDNSNSNIYNHAHTLNVDLEGDFVTYWNQKNSKLRENMRRYIKRANSEIGYERLKIITKTNEMKAAIDAYGRIESKGWKGELGTAIHKNNIQGDFYSEILEKFSITDQAVVFELYFGERLVASQITITNKHLMILLKTTYDEDLKRYAPGRIMLYRLLEREFSIKKRKFVEFYTNANDDQLKWASNTRYIQHVSYFKNPVFRTIYNTIKNEN